MKQSAGEFYNNLKGKRAAFIGAGVSHRECIEVFAKKGAIVTLCDKKPDVNAFGAYGETLKQLGVRLSLGEHYLDGLAGQDIIMRTPGFEYFTPELQAAKAAGSEVTSEMELFFELCPCEKVAVTGSDGKTTTTTLIAEMLKAAGRTVHLGGNLGRALLPVVEQIAPTDVAVVELSSFQLISMRESPDVAVVTNVTPNHLDHHKDMQEYIDAKRNILLYQAPGSRAVLGYANDITRAMAKDVKGSYLWFTRFSETDNGGFLRADGMLCVAKDGVVTPIVHKSEVALRGEHRESRHLGGSAGGRGNGAEARFLAQRGEAERHTQLLKRHFGVLIERPHGFCSVNGAAAAHGHNPIRLEFAHGLGALHHGGNGRIRLNVLEQFHFHASLFQVAHSLIQEAKALHAAAAHNDHRLAALQVFQLFHRTLAMIQVTR